jgi:hypothetical protein
VGRLTIFVEEERSGEKTFREEEEVEEVDKKSVDGVVDEEEEEREPECVNGIVCGERVRES